MGEKHTKSNEYPQSSPTDNVLIERFGLPMPIDGLNVPSVSLQPRPFCPSRPQATSSFLDVFPFELVDMVLFNLDCKSMTRLSATNSKFEAYVKALTFYKRIAEECQTTLYELKHCGLYGTLPVKRIFDLLRNPYCFTCGDLSSSVLIPDIQRCCRSCMGRKADITSIRTETEVDGIDLAYQQLMDGAPPFLQSKWTCACLSIILNFSHKHSSSPLSPNYDWMWLASVQLPFLDPESGKLELGRRCMACGWAVRRFDDEGKPIPYSQASELGLIKDEERRAMFRVYSVEGLLRHIRSGECPHAPQYEKTIAIKSIPYYALMQWLNWIIDVEHPSESHSN
ncbi:uncharacterized protein CIMG_04088 [Coccidioides immitis RS]|uniref:F-box domain-containing protein n=3 Tax=Coccidioides immitis TaxID=5501 RepID=J3KCR8_COCIM|nr:uncharacterized protein CIMG_04088 [Coccidioides immitis RS]EAS33064.3 hypothetical protein CIMG_04088 [Coccidioides immitis RS]TPX19990.1 hypothetical protein DIZ76_017785 [Coccidioides immitis]